MHPLCFLLCARFTEVLIPCGGRFGNTLPKPPPPAQANSARGADLTLSEGFHWESVPGIPPDAHLDEPSSENETKFDPRTLATSERSGAEQGSGEIIATSASEGEQKACKADKKKKKRPATEVSTSLLCSSR